MSNISFSARENRNLAETFKFLVLALHTPEAYKFINSVIKTAKNPRQIAQALSCRTGELAECFPEPLLLKIQWQLISWETTGYLLFSKPKLQNEKRKIHAI